MIGAMVTPAGQRKLGRRLADPRDPVVRRALGRTCPDCRVQPDEWCVGIADKSPTNGRRRSRIHFARCEFLPADVADVKAGVR